MMPWPSFDKSECEVQPGSRLYIYSDGAQEIHKTDGTDWTFPEFIDKMSELVQKKSDNVMKELHDYIVMLNGSPVLDDDLSLLEVRFQ